MTRAPGDSGTSGAPAAVRGPMVVWRGDPFAVGARRALAYEPDAIVAMAGGRIVAAGPASEVRRSLAPGMPVETLPPASLMLPGFVDCHVHYPQLPVTGSHGTQLLDWLERYTFPAEAAFGDARLAGRVARAYLDENLRQGITTASVFCTVHAASVDALMREAAKRSLRLVAGKVLMDRHAPRALRDTARRGYDQSKALIARWHGRGRLGYAITPRFAATSTPAQLEAAGALWREHPSCWVQSHLSENRGEIAWVRKLFPRDRDYAGVYGRFGLLGRRAIYGHGLHLAEREWRALAATQSAIAHSPATNHFLGRGLFAWPRATQAGRPVRVGLGTDVGGGTTLSILRTLGEAYKVAQLAGWSMPPAHAFGLATQGGARALDLDARIGNLVPGAEADLVVLDCASTPFIAQRMAHARDLDEALFVQMTLGDDRAIRQTWVAGRKVHDRDAAGATPTRHARRR
jgi:guanine deaminase